MINWIALILAFVLGGIVGMMLRSIFTGHRKRYVLIKNDAEWIEEYNPNTDIYERRNYSVCSRCGRKQLGKTNFCADCGARMTIGIPLYPSKEVIK